LAKLTIDGRDVIIAPYKLGALRKAAPIIDDINEAISGLADGNVGGMSLADMAELTAKFVAFVAVGTERADLELTAEKLEDSFGIEDLPILQEAFREICEESGLKKGEAKAPAPKTEAAGA